MQRFRSLFWILCGLCIVFFACPVWAGYVNNGNGTVTDISTGLMWQQNTQVNMTWEQALSYCENLPLAGYSDWRLPTKKELRSLVDYSRNFPAVNITFFPDTVSNAYWASTSGADYTNAAWGVSLGYGDDGKFYKFNVLLVRAVRGGQSGSLGNSVIAQQPMSGPPGTTFVEWGTGFTPNSTAVLHFKKPDGTEYQTKDQAITPDGLFQTEYTAPLDKPPGRYTWWAIDGPTQRKSNEVSYEITPLNAAIWSSINTHWYNWATTFDQYVQKIKQFEFIRDGAWWDGLESSDYINDSEWQQAGWGYTYNVNLACENNVSYKSGYDELVKKFQSSDSPELLMVLNNYNKKWGETPNQITYEQNYDYVYHVVERYDGDGDKDMPGLRRPVRFFEVGNEVDNPIMTDEIQLTPENYVSNYLMAAYRAAKDVNPNTVVMNAGLSMEIGPKLGKNKYVTKYLDDMLKTIKKKKGPQNNYYMDVLALHYYRQDQNPEYFLDSYHELITLLKKYDIESKPIWITEYGLETNQSLKEREQASILVRMAALMKYCGIKRNFIYNLKDENRIQQYMGILKVDCQGTAELIQEKESVIALQNLTAKIQGKDSMSLISHYDKKTKGTTYTITFSGGGKNVQMLWYTMMDGSEGNHSDESTPIKVSLGGKSGVLSNMSGEVVNPNVADKQQITIYEQPQFLEY